MYASGTVMTLLTLGCTVMGYNNNCGGSSISPENQFCLQGIAKIDPNAMYNDQSQFSAGNCYIIYATNGSGAQPIKGQTLIDTANNILNSCKQRHGSFGTFNCDACHLTINYKDRARRST